MSPTREAQVGSLGGRALGAFHKAEDLAVSIALAGMMILPLAELALRDVLTGGIPGAIPFVQHLTLWVGLLGATLAAREGKLVALATATFMTDGRFSRAAGAFAALVGAMVCAILASGSLDIIGVYRDLGSEIALGVPIWVAQLVFPFAFGLIALRLVWRAGKWPSRLVAALGLVAGLWLAPSYEILDGTSGGPWVLLLVLAALAGAPIFVVLAGAAVFLYMTIFYPPSQVVLYAYERAVDPTLPAIPLFTLTGFILAQGNVTERLLRVFRALVGWVAGGTAVVCVVVCAFFTVFSGASGVTILALGGLLLPALLKEGYRDQFSVGLLTASGSIGLLLPPALPLILYAVVAQISPEDLFIGGFLPGLLLVGLLTAWAMREGMVTKAGRHPFSWPEVWPALWLAKWELLLPVVVLTAYFTGSATLVETSALAALYAAVVTGLIHRDYPLWRGLGRAFSECGVLVGGVLIIVAVAQGFTQYTLDADIPYRLLEWTQARIESPLVFLLALNVFLLLVGCVMDIFSAIVVVVPLITAIGAAYGIHPVHLGIIFVANLELGYMTPPVGLNLFFASYRFDRPLLHVYRAAVPFLLILAFGVILITYVPWLSLGLLEWLGRSGEVFP
jgi:tripartite ATP-independent transporter DctM subunit